MLFVYIHGFNSSPDSFKAKCFESFLAKNHPEDQFIVPRLSDLPSSAMSSLSALIKQHSNKHIVLIGSSLGGFYATRLAQDYHVRAVLVNPAVNPQELLLDYLGINKNYHTGEEFEFTKEHIVQLDAIMTNNISSPEQLMVLLQSGDEVLDYRLAEKKYSQTQLIVEKGGDHSFQKFEQFCERIYQFLSD